MLEGLAVAALSIHSSLTENGAAEKLFVVRCPLPGIEFFIMMQHCLGIMTYFSDIRILDCSIFSGHIVTLSLGPIGLVRWVCLLSAVW